VISSEVEVSSLSSAGSQNNTTDSRLDGSELNQLKDNGTYGRWTEDFSVQFPLAVDVILTELHLKSNRLSIKHLSAVHRPNHLDVAR